MEFFKKYQALGEFGGLSLHELGKKLFPLNRSLMGIDNLKTLQVLGQFVDFDYGNWKSGTEFGSWSIPKLWNVRAAYIIDPEGKKICDYSGNNLHLTGYSVAVNKKMQLKDLKKKLNYLEDIPDAVPYNTSYYSADWSFNISFQEFKTLKEGEYKVKIDCDFIDGEMDYAHLIVQGDTDEEILISSYICHPSMANNELSGPLVLTALADWLQKVKKEFGLKYTYRFILVPETIGAIAYINTYLKNGVKIKYGLQLTCVGGPDDLTWLGTKNGDSHLDYLIGNLFSTSHRYTFSERGSDERQYAGPGLEIEMISIFRSKYGEYDFYHTSKDNFDFITSKAYKLLITIKKLSVQSAFEKTFGAYDYGEPMADSIHMILMLFCLM